MVALILVDIGCMLGKPAEDIFSLGVVFFQLMSARVPRSGGPDRVQGIFQDMGHGPFEMSRLVESSSHRN